MKKNILLMLVILLTTYANSQTDDFICTTTEEIQYMPEGYSGSIDPNLLATYEPVVYNIFFWQINKDDGSNPRSITENSALKKVADLNKLFNTFNVFFKYTGYDNTSFNSTAYYTGSNLQDIKEKAESRGSVKPNSFNVYIVRDLSIGAGESEYNYTSSVMISFHFLDLEGDNVVLNHEVAHNFDIRHTRSNNEHVTRDENDSNYNAKDEGDFVVDTAACRSYRETNCSPSSDPECYPYLTDCAYDEDSPEQDFSIPPEYYRGTIFPEDVANLMANSGPCRNLFQATIGQGIRIREAIAADVFGEFADAETILEELYLPYKGEYYVEGPHPEQQPLFQPGFEYRFIECSCECPAPADWNENFDYDKNTILSIINKDEIDYTSITHPNHSAIWIKHYDVMGNEVLSQPRKCYDNWNKNPSGGSITLFNDGVLNTNVTITPQDSTAINNPYLIENLENGLYKVEKTYDDGAVQETVIYKGNN